MSEFVDEFGRWVHGSLVAPTALHDALRTGSRNEDGSVTQDNGDGSGTRTTYTPEGEVESVEQLTGLPIPPPPEPDPMVDMQAQLAVQQDQLAAQQALIDELLAALGGGGNG